MFGEGILITELLLLLSVIRKKNLQGSIKILDDTWQDITSASIQAAIQAIEQGNIREGQEIRLRLHT